MAAILDALSCSRHHGLCRILGHEVHGSSLLLGALLAACVVAAAKRLAAHLRAHRRSLQISAALDCAACCMPIGVVLVLILVLILTATPAPASMTAATRAPLHLQSTRKLERKHMQAVRQSMSQVTACAPRDCPEWWRARESALKDAMTAAEKQRLKDHRQLFDGDHLPTSSIAVRDVMAMLSDQRNLAPLLRWASDYSCGDEARQPVLRTGDGYKWVCGAIHHTQPCTLLSLGSAGDDSFERAMQDAAGCTAYIVDPTLNDAGLGNHEMSAAGARTFASRVRARGFSLNGSVGVGGSVSLSGGVPPFPLVRIDQLIADHYGLPAHISAVKIDIEGHEVIARPHGWRARVTRRSASAHAHARLTQPTLNLHPGVFTWLPLDRLPCAAATAVGSAAGFGRHVPRGDAVPGLPSCGATPRLCCLFAHIWNPAFGARWAARMRPDLAPHGSEHGWLLPQRLRGVLVDKPRTCTTRRGARIISQRSSPL